MMNPVTNPPSPAAERLFRASCVALIVTAAAPWRPSS